MEKQKHKQEHKLELSQEQLVAIPQAIYNDILNYLRNQPYGVMEQFIPLIINSSKLVEQVMNDEEDF